MGMLDISIVKKYIRMADDGWYQGWHERNGGNLTYRLKAEEVAEMAPFFDVQPHPWVGMGVTGENLAGEYFLSTGSGKFFRNVITDPEDSICVVEINDKGDSYRIRWGLVNGGRPTSEFPSHYMNHCVRAKATNGAHRVIYHAHPANIIAMTFVLPLTDRDFTRALWCSPAAWALCRGWCPAALTSLWPPARRWRSSTRRCGRTMACLPPALTLTSPSA